MRERVVERELLLRGEVGDHRPGVHFGAGGRQGHHVAERNDFADFVFIEHQLPGIAVVGNARSDELGTVKYRAAAHREQKIDLFGFALGNGFAQGFDFGIRLDAPELYEVAAFERCDHLVVHAVFLDGAAAESNHDLLVGRNLFRQLGDGAFAEDQLDRILESEVVHIDKDLEFFDIQFRTHQGICAAECKDDFLIVANVRECEFLPYAVFQPFPGRLIAAYEEIPGDGTYIAEILPIIDEYFFIFIADFRDFVRSAFRIGDRQFPAVGIFHQMQPTQFGTCLW